MTTPEESVRLLAPSSVVEQVSRRAFLAGAGATVVGSSVFLTACGSDETSTGSTSGGADEPLEDQVFMYTWGEYDSPKVLKSFTKEYGPTLQLDSYNSNEQMISKLIAAKGTGGFDLVVPTGPFIPQMVDNDLLEELDLTRLPNFENVDEAYLNQPWDEGNKYSVPKAWGTTGYAYDSSKISKEMSTWQDFLDVATGEASGQVSILDSPDNLCGLYFWANDINWMTTDPAQLDACEDYMVNQMAPHVKRFDSYPGGGGIAEGSYWLSHAWNGDARQGIIDSGGNDWKWVFPGPRTEIWMDNWCIPVGVKNPNAAYAWINYVLDPKVSLAELSYIGYHTAVKGIEPAANEAGLERLDIVFFTPEQVETMESGELNDAQQRRVEISNKTKAAAGA
jgi:spermidine/putrescine transport system substrate-binding protein